MSTKLLTFTAVAFLLLGVVVIHWSGNDSPSPPAAAKPSIGDVRTLQAAYDRWRAAYIRGGGDRKLTLALGHSKGLSARFTAARGQATLDLVDGSLSVSVSGLPDRQAFDVWLVDNRSGAGQSVRPEPGDGLMRVGRLKAEGRTASLQAPLDPEARAGFKVDLVVVAPAGEAPGAAGLLFGSPTLFQRLFYSDARGPIAGLGETATAPAPGSPGGTAWSAPFRVLIPSPAFAAETEDARLAALVADGEDLFFNEPFAGNGRTCGTCHPAENNFTIDPAFIKTLPPTDPLFVAEFTPALSTNFENPTLMRRFGLILENVDGFGDLANKFVMRGVPHTLALPTSLAPAPGDGTTIPPNDRTGWSGDGAPGTGTLRDFATGAVTQHFTKTLNRTAGVDFRLPTDSELDAMEAFQLSLGRPEDPDLTTLVFPNSEPRVQTGVQLFSGTAGCSVCHLNAGASTSIGQGGNRNFNTGVEDLPKPPGTMPRDGGFGLTLNPDGTGGFGNGTFNTPSLVEAADTAPFFHNNAVKTLEEAVAFYGSKQFVNSAPGRAPLINSRAEADAVAAFLRVMNALENIRSSTALLERARTEQNVSEAQELRTLAAADIDDAIDVLTQGKLHARSVTHLRSARQLITGDSVRTSALQSAIREQEAAQDLMVTITH